MVMNGDAPIEVHPLRVRNHDYRVRLDNQGRFLSEAGGETLISNTRDGLKDKLMEMTAKASVSVSIPFTLMTPSGMPGKPPASGIVTGIHGGNGNLLVTWVTGWQAGQRTQWTPSYGDVIFGEVGPEDTEQWRKLRNLKVAAERDLFDFEKERKIDLKVLAATAVQEAVNSANAA